MALKPDTSIHMNVIELAYGKQKIEQLITEEKSQRRNELIKKKNSIENERPCHSNEQHRLLEIAKPKNAMGKKKRETLKEEKRADKKQEMFLEHVHQLES